ncbi:GNAT family N-acetyltransferase [Bdellovibrionota bacterium FG-2]
MNKIRIEKLTEANFTDYEELTRCGKDGGCYCAFWHQKWASMESWIKREKEAPELNRATVLDRVRSGFHVGVLAYRGEELLGWISVGPLTDFYWTWKRAIAVGEASKNTAGITCITLAPKFRNQGL